MGIPDWVVIVGVSLYVVGGVFFAFGYGDTEPEYPKLPAWKAFSFGAMWPAWLMVLAGRAVRQVVIRWDTLNAEQKTRRQPR